MRGLRPLAIEDFLFTDADVKQALIEEQEFQNGPRPFETFNPLTLVCMICRAEHQDIYGHHCKVIWAADGPE